MSMKKELEEGIMLQKVRDYLKQELNDVIQVEENSQDDYIVMGRKELAEGLLSQMEKWETEEELHHE